MRCLTRVVLLMLLALPAALQAQEAPDSGAESVMEQANAATPVVTDEDLQQRVEQLKEPLYNPFIERYIIDEIKNLRSEIERQRVEMIQ
ncbi:MAG: hypothetical protein ACPHXW_06240, partial [Marinobacterium sp.]